MEMGLGSCYGMGSRQGFNASTDHRMCLGDSLVCASRCSAYYETILSNWAEDVILPSHLTDYGIRQISPTNGIKGKRSKDASILTLVVIC
jgi:hypothetical protein